MPNAKSHHLNNLEQHVLVATDHKPREASYTTTMDDGTKAATVHVLYWEKNPDKDGADPLATVEKGEVRSCLYDDYPKLDNPIVLPPEPEPVLTFDQLVGTDAALLPEEAQEALRLFGGVDSAGKVLAVEAWSRWVSRAAG